MPRHVLGTDRQSRMRLLPPLQCLRSFEAAARLLSFTAAAQELHVTQSAVSQRIRHLEDSLGVRLFHRLTRRLALTAEGEIFAGHTQRALELIVRAAEELKAADRPAEFSIAAVPS